MPVMRNIISKLTAESASKQIKKMKRIIGKRILAAAILISAGCFSATAQKKKVVANPTYDKASGMKRLFLGHHYRKEWATEVEVEIINLDTEAGGLTAIKMGGGKQTKSVRMKGADGKEYVLRSVNKDPSKVLVAELQGTFAEDIVQDQISSSNPYAPVVIAPLAAAAGIFHTTPRIVYVPASPRLGEFEKEFAGTLCLFEERPSGNEENNPAYGNSKDIVNSEKLFEKIMTDPDHRVDEKAFLRARLFDMWINDWDRHEDQWLWASFKVDAKTIYQPIPRDRDQAFSLLDGLLPRAATKPWSIRRIKSFEYKITDVPGQNLVANFLDRGFLAELTLSDWQAISKDLQSRLTDEVIESAFKLMPAEIFNISGKEIVAKLKKRRNDLEHYAVQYYKFISKEVDVRGTMRKEVFEVNRVNSESTLVSVYKTDRSGNKGGLIYKRTFLRSETKELRLYGLGSDDVFNIDGKVSKGIVVRVIGGKGKDSVVDASSVSGMGHKTKVYDDKNNIIDGGKETRNFITNDSLKNDFHVKGFKYDWLGPRVSPGYNPDDGVYLGGGITYKKQSYGKAPFGSMQSVWGNYAFATGAYNFGYEGLFIEAIGKWNLAINARLNAPNYVRNFYGLGNETERITDNRNYYRVRSNQFILTPSLQKQFGSHHSLNIGGEYQTIKVEKSEGRFVADVSSKLDSSDFERRNYGGAFVNYQFSSLDDILYPRKGVRMIGEVKYTGNLNEDKNFVRVKYESSFFISAGAFTLALRAGVSANLSDEFEFFQANTLGGTENLRGYRRDRFAGKTAFYNNSEVRINAGHLNTYLVTGKWGILAFFDNGRVWMPDETSNQWHYGYGGGLWLVPFNRFAVSAMYGISEESKVFTLKAGFQF